jgi:hypothetical protein
MRIACWIPKAKHALRICNSCFSTATRVSRRRLESYHAYINRLGTDLKSSSLPQLFVFIYAKYEPHINPLIVGDVILNFLQSFPKYVNRVALSEVLVCQQ